MSAPELPADLRRFLLTSVPSVPYLEALLLLRGEPQRAWDAGTLARRLYVSEREGADLARQLRENGVAAAEGDGTVLHYAPAPELTELLDRVAHAYAADLVGVSSLIHSRIDRRAQQFADAFRFRKD
jgi:hypothetical protein